MPRAKRKKPEVEAPVVEAEAKKEEVTPVVKPEDEAPVVKPEDEAEEFDPAGKYVVSEGRCIACRKGILKPGSPAESKDFGGGEFAMREHYDNGGLVKA